MTSLPLQSESDGHAEPAIGVPAFTLSTRIVRREVAKTILKSIHSEIKRDLDVAPSWVSERVEDFVTKADLLPFVKNKPKSKLGGVAAPTGGSSNADTALAQYSITPEVAAEGNSEEGVEVLARNVQEFYLDLEEELSRRRWRLGRQVLMKNYAASHSNGSASASSGDEKDKEKDGAGEEGEEKGPVTTEKEQKVREVMELVERTLCAMFYDR